MKRLLFVLPLVALMMVSCDKSTNPNTNPPVEGETKLVVDYLNVGGASIPDSWDDSDTASTVRSASYTVNGESFTLDFVGKWRISTNNQELQTKKDPASFVRATSSLVVKRVIIETFSADVDVYSTVDMSGDKLTGTEATPVHSDGDALEYTLNSSTWSFFAKETYKGSAVNIYSFSFYF